MISLTLGFPVVPLERRSRATFFFASPGFIHPLPIVPFLFNLSDTQPLQCSLESSFELARDLILGPLVPAYVMALAVETFTDPDTDSVSILEVGLSTWNPSEKKVQHRHLARKSVWRHSRTKAEGGTSTATVRQIIA